MPGESPAAEPGPTEPESSPPPPASPPGSPPLPPPPTAKAAASRPPLGLDRQGLLEAAGGSVIALIALFSSYDHITIAGNRIPLQQQWGVWLIAASLALVVIDAELATRSRSREKARLDREEYRFHRAEHSRQRADDSSKRAEDSSQRAEDARQREALEADRERYRAAERAERQRQEAALANQCALLSGRLQLDPSPTNRDRFRAFLALMADATGAVD